VRHESTRGDQSDSGSGHRDVRDDPATLGYCEEGDNGPVSFNKIMAHPEVPEAKPFRAYEMVTAVPPLIDEFKTRTEAKLKR